MRDFNYGPLPSGLLTSETMNLLSEVHEWRGKVSGGSVAPALLDAMVEVAKVQSAGASNRIEGIQTTDKRLEQIMAEGTELKSRDEEEIAGYRDVLSTIHESYNFIDVAPNVILQLHKQMYRHTPLSFGGQFKIGDNEIRGIRADGSQYVRFKTAPAVATSAAMDDLCKQLSAGLANGKADPLLLSFMFIFDFTCIHPFNDGNGRMSRLLTLLLLYKSGYDVGRYVSIEKEIERTKNDYYESLAASSLGWEDGNNDYGPFVRYMLGIVIACYRDFEERTKFVKPGGAKKGERIERALSDAIGLTTKADILKSCPDISQTTVERTLAALLKQNKIEKVGRGKLTAYHWRG